MLALLSEMFSFINLSIKRREPYLVFVCENSNPGDVVSKQTRRLLTSKNDARHGYGLEIIRRIAQSYNGMLETDYDEDKFEIVVAIED